jgi:tetratricopeptide (TPR) repeat protein
MKVKIVKVPKSQEGISIPVTSGENTEAPVAELEQGEVYKDTEGDVLKVSDQAPTHENGGVLLDDVHKVLEDTGDKRDDEDSKNLLMTPEEVYERTGFKPKRKLTHSKAYELAVDHNEKKLKRVERKIKEGLKYAKLTGAKASENSLDLNLELLNTIPTKDDLFESIFQHQEEVKVQKGITPEGNEAQVGKFNYINAASSEADDSIDALLRGTQAPTIPPTLQDKLREAVNAGIIELPKGANFNSIDAAEAETNNESDRQKSGLPRTTKPSEFNEPLTANDLLQPLYSILNSRKTPVRVNFPTVYKPSLRLLDPKPQLEAAEASFNKALELLPSNAIGYANMANLYAQKYQVQNQVLGQYENMNKQMLNQYDEKIANLRTMESASNVNLIDQFETKRLTRDEAFRQQRMADLGNISDKIALNRRFNREGQYLLNMFPHFDQNAQYNNNQYEFTTPTSTPQTTGAPASAGSPAQPFEVQMIRDETGNLVPFVALPTNNKGGLTWKRVVTRNNTFTNIK